MASNKNIPGMKGPELAEMFIIGPEYSNQN